MYKKNIKSLLDFTVALLGFLLISPLLLCVALFLAIANNGTPFFFQTRPGLHGKPFRIIKFKTMNDKCGVDGELLSDEIRLTKIGGFVRSTSLDELPQLLNVLKGELSLVGPRPLLMEYLPLYSDEQGKRHDVKPGITGWAQVNGRNAISWEEKFRLDVEYVHAISFVMDVRILLMTVKKVIVSEGISAVGQVTIKNFKGN